jgi:hypothetical protein
MEPPATPPPCCLSPHTPATAPPPPPPPKVCLFIFAFSVSWAGLYWVVVSELFTMVGRGRDGVGWGRMAGRAGQWVGDGQAGGPEDVRGPLLGARCSASRGPRQPPSGRLVYPKQAAKSPATSCATALLFLSGAAADFTFLSLNSAAGAVGAFLVFSAVSAAGSAFVAVVLPETAGCTLAEVQALLAAPARGGGAARGGSAAALVERPLQPLGPARGEARV